MKSLVLWGLGLWLLDLFVLPLWPFLKSVLDPLLLLTIFLGLKLPSTRWLWAYGLGLGGLKDLASVGLFGGWSVTLALVGWLIGIGRHLWEREDPLLLGIWAGMLAGVGYFFYAWLEVSVDPLVSWGRWWTMLPLVVVVQGTIAAIVFPRLNRLF